MVSENYNVINHFQNSWGNCLICLSMCFQSIYSIVLKHPPTHFVVFIWELVDSIPLLLWVMELRALREAAPLSRRLPRLVKLSPSQEIKSLTLLGKLGNEVPFSIAYVKVCLFVQPHGRKFY